MTNLQNFFSLLNKTFDHIYVITLQRATDRQAHLYTELEGLDYELFYGKDKLDFSIDELISHGIYNDDLARKHHRYGKPMPAGMIGCSWSHAEVYKNAIRNGYNRILIMEDDVVINKAGVSFLGQVLNELPANWELLYFGFAENETVPPLAPFKKTFYHLLRVFGAITYTHNTISHLFPKRISTHIWRAGYHDCTHAYALTLAGAKKLLKLQTPISFFPDNLLAYAATNGLVKAYTVRPKLINQQYQVGTPSASYINQ